MEGLTILSGSEKMIYIEQGCYNQLMNRGNQMKTSSSESEGIVIIHNPIIPKDYLDGEHYPFVNGLSEVGIFARL